jgi:Ca-activated chloride channel family protein
MEALDFATRADPDNRLDAAKKVIRKFIEMRPHDRISLIGFAALPYMISPLTPDHGYLIDQIDRLEIGMVDDGTGIGSALASGVNHLRDSEATSKVIILLTDGINNTGISPLNAAEAANALGIRTYTVGAGADGKVRFPYRSPFGGVRYRMEESHIDEETLSNIAKATNGRYFRAKDYKALEKVYEEINELERTEIEVDNFTRYEEHFVPIALAGILLLLAEKVLALTKFGRLP